ncbi:hypothetical protein HGRIS_001089 [Hohenbuehelia grisea]|uniref:Uncharacterized protein n=1 Tax=Hohenbuehelia grisea TaxID=104357 RepID=A0ABR3JN76_9AGAR
MADSRREHQSRRSILHPTTWTHAFNKTYESLYAFHCTHLSISGLVKQLGRSLGCVTPVLLDENTWNIPDTEGLAPLELSQVGPRIKAHWHVIMRDNTAAGGNIDSLSSLTSNPGDGDGVSDTPPQLKLSDRCDEPVHGCGPENPPDVTDNDMNYVPDECRKRFTPGQIECVRKFLKEARGGQSTTLAASPITLAPPGTYERILIEWL